MRKEAEYKSLQFGFYRNLKMSLKRVGIDVVPSHTNFVYSYCINERCLISRHSNSSFNNSLRWQGRKGCNSAAFIVIILFFIYTTKVTFLHWAHKKSEFVFHFNHSTQPINATLPDSTLCCSYIRIIFTSHRIKRGLAIEWNQCVVPSFASEPVRRWRRKENDESPLLKWRGLSFFIVKRYRFR